MRSVCKPWNVLLSESSFVKSHLNHSINNNDEILLFFDMIFSFDRSSLTACLSRSPDLELANFIKPPVIPKRKYGCGFLIGSVNGLICFSYKSSLDDYFLHMWNPSLSAALTLPPSSLPSDQLHFGFGYVPKTDDYKVLKLTSFSRPPNRAVQGEVYSMRKGSWKLISPQSFPSHILIPGAYNSQVCVDDHLHWLSDTDLESKPRTIVGFNPGEEAFIEIPLPDSILDFKVYKPFNVLGALGGKLCVITRVRDGSCEVWVMKKYGFSESWVMDAYGVSESWVKHEVFPPFSGDIIPYGFTSHGEFLFQVGVNDDRFGLYDPAAAKTKTFKITSRNSSIMRFAEYVDSLVWVPPPNSEVSSCGISQLQSAK